MEFEYSVSPISFVCLCVCVSGSGGVKRKELSAVGGMDLRSEGVCEKHLAGGWLREDWGKATGAMLIPVNGLDKGARHEGGSSESHRSAEEWGTYGGLKLKPEICVIVCLFVCLWGLCWGSPRRKPGSCCCGRRRPMRGPGGWKAFRWLSLFCCLFFWAMDTLEGVGTIVWPDWRAKSLQFPTTEVLRKRIKQSWWNFCSCHEATRCDSESRTA